jgi:hypothetical protein
MTPYFFGYGSLVNRATHDHPDAQPASVTGWRRIWRHTALRPVAFLTVIPDPDTSIDGLVAAVPRGDWLALDEREHAYDRVRAEQVTHGLIPDTDVHLYTIPDGKHGAPDRTHPVLLSYLDTVVQGYLNEFGVDGVGRFFDTTSGWDAPIADDRSRPLYARHQNLTRAQKALTDDHLNRLGARLVEPPTL